MIKKRFSIVGSRKMSDDNIHSNCGNYNKNCQGGGVIEG